MTSHASRNSFVSSHSTSIPNDPKHRSAAFQGATNAFSRSSSTRNGLPNAHSGANGALAAASTAGLGKQNEEASRVHLGVEETGRFSVRRSRTSGSLDGRETAPEISQSREQSPSYVAALLATSRASRITPNRESSPLPASRPQSKRPSPLHSMEDLISPQATNEAFIGDTKHLVELFETKQKPPASTPVTHSIRYVTKATPLDLNTRPGRPIVRSISSATSPQREEQATVITPKRGKRDATTSANPSQSGPGTTVVKSVGPARKVTPHVKHPASSLDPLPVSPAPRRAELRSSMDGPPNGDGPFVTNARSSMALRTPAVDATETFLNNATQELHSRAGKSPKRPSLPVRHTEPAALPPNASLVAALPPPLVSYQTSPLESSDRAQHERKTTRSSDTFVPQLTVDSLANAMVASSLASSRAPSPSKPPPLPPPRRHGKNSLFHHHSQEESRTPSPAKGMRQTMRESVRSDDEDDGRKHRSHRVRKHPNKHHEGDRKRYRDQVNERERKRYEGVWAANKGILMGSDSSNAVLNIVVRDIWKRSRLPDDVLEEVWNLVDTHSVSKLEREEFIVGMFLIDQRLKGNKLPFRISESIWSSVRRLTGVNLTKDRR